MVPGEGCRSCDRGWHERRIWCIPYSMILQLQNPKNPSIRLSMNGKTHMHSTFLAFVASMDSEQALRFSKDERKVFRQNHSLFRFAALRDFRVCYSRIIVLITALLLSPISTF